MRRGFLTHFKTQKYRPLSAKSDGNDNAYASPEVIAEWTSKTNVDPLTVDRYLMSRDFRARAQKLIFHHVEFDTFRGIMLLDESVLNLLPTKPFSPLQKISHPTPFETSMTANKGLAMFATRDIIAGETIHSENPVVVI